MRSRRKISIVAGFVLLVVTVAVSVQPALGCLEGCSPGFWKNHVSVPPWPTLLCVADNGDWMFPMPLGKCSVVLDLGPEPWNFLVQDVFTLPDELLTDGNLDLNGDGEPDTLLDALNYDGGPDLAGKAGNLLRQAVASLLNGGTMAHKPPWSVIRIVNNVLARHCGNDWCGYQYWYDVFTANNEQGGPMCPD